MPLPRRQLLIVLALGLLVPCLVLVAGKYPLDLDVYRQGGQAVAHHQALYDVRLGRYGFTYPPFAALLFTVAGLLPLTIATLLATALSIGALALVLRWTCAPLLSRSGTYGPLLVLALVASSPVRETLWNGQVNLVLMGLVLSDVLGVTPRRWRGALIGVAAAIKLTPALFVVYLIVRGRRSEALRAVAAFALVTATAAVVLPADSARFWRHEAWGGGGIGDMARVANQSVHGAVLRGDGSPVVWILLAVPVVLCGLALAVRASRADHEALAAGVVGLVACLVSPVSWEHHWVWVIPCLGSLAALTRSVAEQQLVAVVCGVFVVGSQDVPEVLSRSLPPLGSVSAWLLNNLFVATALLGGALFTMSGWRRPASTRGDLVVTRSRSLQGVLSP